MRRSITHLLGMLVLSISLHSFVLVADAAAQDQPAVSLQVFYDDLHPYGQWISDDQYGYAWVPNVEDDFRPYATNGYWVMTEFGNTWVSNYPWGWAPFHYGRWIYDSYYGWVWIPGYEWGPAWVCWRYGSGYYGWAPLGPWFTVTVAFGGYNCPNDWWVFIPKHQLYHRRPRHRRPNTTVINNTTIIVNTHVHNHITHITGPRADEVHSATGNNVQVYNVQDVRTPGALHVRGNSVQMYRPSISRNEEGQAPVRPTSVIKGPKAISAPRPVRSNGGSLPPFKNETRPSKQPQAVPDHRSPTPKQAPTRHKTVMPRPQQQAKPGSIPSTKPVQKRAPKPRVQPKPTPAQQRPAQQTEQRTSPQQQRQPVKK